MGLVAADLTNQAHRRARLAALLGRLLLQEPGPDAAPLVAGVPELEPLGRHAPDLAADFERLLLRQVPVFESVFRSQSGQRGGAVVADVVGWYQRHDFDEGGQWRVASVDHLGLELRFLGHLAALEAAAWADDRAAEACRAVEAQREFLAHHLGQWGEVAAAAVQRRAAHGPFAALASATAELLAEEGERLRPAPDHPGFPEVVADLPTSHVGPARVAEWLLAPSRSGAFLDAEDLADAATSIGVPWRPSDTRRRFHDVVGAALESGDLAALLHALRPALLRWHDTHAAHEACRDGNRRVWKRWRLQAEATIELVDRLTVASAPPETRGVRPVVVEVRGAGHSHRALAATRVVHALATLEATVAVSDQLESELADDVAALLDAGASEVLLSQGPVTALAQRDGGDYSERETRQLGQADMIVRLVASAGPLRTDVSGEGELAADVRHALRDLALTAVDHKRPVSGA